MRDWASAGDRIRRRSALAVIRSLEVQTPFHFDPQSSESEVPDFLEQAWDGLTPHDHVADLPGRDVNFARDMLITVTKFYHVSHCTDQRLASGALTWSLVDAYHAAFLGARAIAAMYGILTYTVRRRTILIDFRPELGTVDEARKFRREHRAFDEPIRILRPTKHLLDQGEAWKLLTRLAAITNDIEDERKFASELADLSKAPSNQLRNKLMYDSVYWTWPADFGIVSPTSEWIEANFDKADVDVLDLLTQLQTLTEAVNRYASELSRQIGFDLSSLPKPANISVR